MHLIHFISYTRLYIYNEFYKFYIFYPFSYRINLAFYTFLVSISNLFGKADPH